jgi:hypothetical protein
MCDMIFSYRSRVGSIRLDLIYSLKAPAVPNLPINLAKSTELYSRHATRPRTYIAIRVLYACSISPNLALGTPPTDRTLQTLETPK